MKDVYDKGEALSRISKRMCKGGKIEFLGCEAFQGQGDGKKFKELLERMFGAGNVLGPSRKGYWDIKTGEWVDKPEGTYRHVPGIQAPHGSVPILGK